MKYLTLILLSACALGQMVIQGNSNVQGNTGAGAFPGFSLSTSPTSVNITQGSNATSTVTVTGSNGFSGNVTLSCVAPPSYLTCGFSPNPTASTSTLTLTAASNAPLNTGTVNIQGTSGGLISTVTESYAIQSSGGGTFTLTITVGGSGSVTSSPGTINCNPTCSNTFSSGTAVTLTETPQNGQTFSGWGGDCSGSGTNTTCSLTMSAGHNASATFSGPGGPLSYGARTDQCGSNNATDPTNCPNGKVVGQSGGPLAFRYRASDTPAFANLAVANTSATDPDFNSYEFLATDTNSVCGTGTQNNLNLRSAGSYSAWALDSSLLLIRNSGGADCVYYINTVDLLAHTCATAGVHRCAIYTGITTSPTAGSCGDSTHLANANAGKTVFSSLAAHTLKEFCGTVISNVVLTDPQAISIANCAANQNCTLTRTTWVDFTKSVATGGPVDCGATAPAGGNDRVANEILPTDYVSGWTGTFACSDSDVCGLPMAGGGDWHANTTFTALESWIVPQTGNAGNYAYQAIVGGISGGTPPTWNQTSGTTFTDGGVTWRTFKIQSGQGNGFDVVIYDPSHGCTRLNTALAKTYVGVGNTQPSGPWMTDQASLGGSAATPVAINETQVLHDGQTQENGDVFSFAPTGGETSCATAATKYPGFINNNCVCKYVAGQNDWCDAYYFHKSSGLVRACLDLHCEGHSIIGFTFDFRAKQYWKHAVVPVTSGGVNCVDGPTTGGNPGNGCPDTPLISSSFPSDQHCSYNNVGSGDAQPALCGASSVPTIGRIGAGKTLAWYGEVFAPKTDGSGTVYRFASTEATGTNGNFNAQNAIINTSQDGKFVAIPTDEMGTRGSTAADWVLLHGYGLGNILNPTGSNNTNRSSFQIQGGACTSGSSEPNFNTASATGNTIADGSCTWTNTSGSQGGSQVSCNNLRGDYKWSSGSTIALNDFMYPINNNQEQNVFKLIAVGINCAGGSPCMPSTQPNWHTTCPTYNNICTDANSNQWQALGPNDCRSDIKIVDLNSAHGN